MKSAINHLIFLAGLCCVAALASCVRTISEEIPQSEDEAMLVLTTGVAGARTGEADLPDNEKMHTLRVIVVRQNGIIECNELYTGLNASEETHTELLSVKPNETKKVCLVANEESVSGLTAVLDAASVGSAFSTSGILNFTFNADYSSDENIPMSSIYDVVVGSEEQTNVELYVVRTAVKFSLSFTNNSSDKAFISNVSLSSTADKSYLFPHFNTFDGFDGLSEHFYVKKESHSLSDGSQVNRIIYDPNKSQFWIDWLKEVVDASNVDPDDPATDEQGWLTDYSLPADAQHSVVWQAASPFELYGYGSNAGSNTASYDDFYLAESASPLDEAEAVISGEQAYYLSLKISQDEAGNTEVRDYTGDNSIQLPNVRSLFRNTHVKVNVVVAKGTTAIYAGIVLWGVLAEKDGVIELDPDQSTREVKQ